MACITVFEYDHITWESALSMVFFIAFRPHLSTYLAGIRFEIPSELGVLWSGLARKSSMKLD